MYEWALVFKPLGIVNPFTYLPWPNTAPVQKKA